MSLYNIVKSSCVCLIIHPVEQEGSYGPIWQLEIMTLNDNNNNPEWIKTVGWIRSFIYLSIFSHFIVTLLTQMSAFQVFLDSELWIANVNIGVMNPLTSEFLQTHFDKITLI